MPNSLPPRWSVRTLILWLIIVCLLPAVAGTVGLFLHMYRDGRAQLERNTLQTVRTIVSAVDSELVRAQIVADALASSTALQSGDFAVFYRRANELRRMESAGFNVALTDESGRQVLNTVRPYGEPLPRYGNMEQIRRVFATGQTSVSSVFLGEITAAYKITVDVPVMSEGKVKYVVSVGLLSEQLQEILRGQQLPPDWVSAIVDGSGVIAARTHLPEQYVGKKGAAKFVSRLSQASEGMLDAPTKEGIPSLVIYSKSPISHWSVAIAIPRQSLEADLIRSVTLLALGIGLLFVVSGGLAWVVGGLISRSVNALRAPAHALEKGEPFAISDVHFQEAHEVAKAMFHASQLLGQRTAELESLNQNLEDKVEVRSRRIDDLNRLLREVMESLPFGVAVYDEKRHLILHNELYGVLLDLPRNFLDRQPVQFAEVIRYCVERGDFGQGDFDQIHAGFVHMMEMRESVCFERRQTNGVYLEIRGLPILAGSTLLTYTDITAHKMSEQVLEEARTAADAATSAKSTFLASMSHEIRTPMNAIIGLAYLLGKEDLPEKAHASVRKITLASRSLLSIINDILDFSKIEAGQIKVEQARFSLGSVLDNLSSIMYGTASDKDIELVITPPQGGIDWLEGDALRLEQILVNLVGNGIKFTDAGHVEVNICMIAESEQGITLRFAVRDTGIGISLDKQKSIFDSFSQEDASTTRRFGGTGLGLTISHRFVKIMGGEMGVNSRPGEGSEFWFTLSFPRSHEATTSVPEMSQLNLLIADDNAIARHALHRVTLALGWTAHIVDSGIAAINYLEQQQKVGVASHRTDVIVLDWKMPDLDGLATARAIRDAGHADKNSPIVIMVTAYSSDELLGSPYSELADVVLNKPVTTSSLYNAIAVAQRARYGVRVESRSPQLQRLVGVRILVTDDSEINREVATRILADEGAMVACASDGREAVDWLESHPGEIDMVLMDVQMPVMDGYDATRLIRVMPGLAKLPVIALTAGAFKKQEDAARAAGMSGFIAKPFDVDATVALILKHVGESSRPLPLRRPPPELVADAFAEGDYPGIAVKKGLELWRDEEIYRQYLRKFARDYGDSVKRMSSMTRTEAATLLHKMIGAAGSLALEELASLARDSDRVLRVGKDAAAMLAMLQSSLQTTLASIERYAPNEIQDSVPLTADWNAAKVARTLVRAIEAFDSDDPAAVKPVLTELSLILPRARLAALHEALESYNFREGERAVRALATELNITMEN